MANKRQMSPKLGTDSVLRPEHMGWARRHPVVGIGTRLAVLSHIGKSRRIDL